MEHNCNCHIKVLQETTLGAYTITTAINMVSMGFKTTLSKDGIHIRLEDTETINSLPFIPETFYLLDAADRHREGVELCEEKRAEDALERISALESALAASAYTQNRLSRG